MLLFHMLVHCGDCSTLPAIAQRSLEQQTITSAYREAGKLASVLTEHRRLPPHTQPSPFKTNMCRVETHTYACGHIYNWYRIPCSGFPPCDPMNTSSPCPYGEFNYTIPRDTAICTACQEAEKARWRAWSIQMHEHWARRGDDPGAWRDRWPRAYRVPTTWHATAPRP